MQSAVTHPTWNWRRITDGLTQQECTNLLATCRTWSKQLRETKAGFLQNLNFNGRTNPAELLAQAASIPWVAASVRRLSFEFCNQLQNFDLTPLDQFPSLEELNLNGCRNITDSAVEIVAERCMGLRRLDLYWDVVLTDISMNALATAAFPPLLTHLNLSGLKHITDEATVLLLRRCVSLTFLDLTRCEGLRDESMKAIGASCPKIKTLLLYATPNVTDVGFEALAPGLPELTHLDITGMKLITDRSIQSLARHCRKLKVLHLMWVTPLTDASLIAMGAAPLTHLQLLSIHGNVHMTATGIEALAKGCVNIEKLDINGVKNIGDYRANLPNLQKIFPRLKQLIPM